MKTQTVFSYVVTESVKVKDDNGNIESIKKKILAHGVLPAYDESNARIKPEGASSAPGIVRLRSKIPSVIPKSSDAIISSKLISSMITFHRVNK